MHFHFPTTKYDDALQQIQKQNATKKRCINTLIFAVYARKRRHLYSAKNFKRITVRPKS